MSESLKSWLFTHASTQATLALEGNYDLADMPFHSGNRIQLLRFLTFRPAHSPNSTNTDVWALVGDRSHCIAARFTRDQVSRFHTDHAVSFTSLKGALVTLTHVRVTVARVQVEGTVEGAYRDGQYALVLDVRGWEVVSSVNEPVWFAGVKLVTSRNGVPVGQGREWETMTKWLKKWVRYKSVVRKAREEQERLKRTRDGHPAEPIASGSGSGVLPTPGQRRRVLNSSQVHNSQVAQVAPVQMGKASQEESFPTTTMSSQPQADHNTNSTLWTDFDLDAEVNMDDVELNAWGLPPAPAANVEASQGLAQVAQPPLSTTAREASQAPQSAPIQPEGMARQTHTQTQTQSDLDSDESGLSDYERESRRKRKRGKGTPRAATIESQPAARPDDDVPTAAEHPERPSAPPQQPSDNTTVPTAAAPGNLQTSTVAIEAAVPAEQPVPAPSDEATTTAVPDAAKPRIRTTEAMPFLRRSDNERRLQEGSAATLSEESRGETPAPTSSIPDSTATSTRKGGKLSSRRKRQAALAALMAQIVD
ncbi:hypothetical protein PSEUBRA_001581 [Kalmanozyma brasiliensis GHG001]|uniref:Uncharacterized protein n=1 Tax=Kalmanozyma brasiliensis (strain GHG001) TaxID=1365824 RepID=V5GSG7_KALBG|nr:uncharacterized protein PSEUBRA_001581 [Kalmanozyma brasiliensis GHG001]EST08872.1 hypothetical protein PSEUBRA_001581 [Kalmanozyma brasiliensis GHG001]